MKSLRTKKPDSLGEGERQAQFAAHKKILCESSHLFNAACKPEWMKPEDRVIKMPEDDPEAFHAMVYWMYHNEVCVTNAILKRPIGPSSKGTMTSAWGLFAKVFVLGQKYQLPRLENDAIDAIVTYWESEDFTLGIAPWSYKYTSDGCGLCRLIIRIAKHDIDHGDFN